MKEKLRIIFMGTPEFAVPGLQKLVESGYNIVAVVTAPDKPKGRGKKLGTSAVKDYALTADLPILQPTNLKSPEFLEELASFKADLQIVVAFRMLPVAVWDMPPLGSYNLHASLLPNYRGAAPINWAIINGEKETGVTTFKLKHEIDTGNILFQEKEPILSDDNVGTLYERLMHKGAELLLKTVETISSGEYELKPQIHTTDTKHAPKIFKEDCEISWNQTGQRINDFIRGLNPYPAAWTKFRDQTMKIYEAKISDQNYSSAPGTFHSDGKNYIDVKTEDGSLRLMEIQLQGKKRMKTADFLRGYHWDSSN
ncbi:MAG: methionyl-tRNA formyltransferase [Cyclobacteriaceae bacterium]